MAGQAEERESQSLSYDNHTGLSAADEHSAPTGRSKQRGTSKSSEHKEAEGVKPIGLLNPAVQLTLKIITQVVRTHAITPGPGSGREERRKTQR